ncbi:MAG: 50S ribosomal protein L27 [bacterium]
MARKKGAGVGRNGRDSNPKYLGVKISDGQQVVAGNILLRQRGYRIHAGKNVGVGKDYTLYALKPGIVRFFTRRKGIRFVEVLPSS